MKRLRCIFGHKWNYDADFSALVNTRLWYWARECRRCGRKEIGFEE